MKEGLKDERKAQKVVVVGFTNISIEWKHDHLKFYITQMHFFGCILLRKKMKTSKNMAVELSLQHTWIITVHKLSHLLHGHTTWILQNAPNPPLKCNAHTLQCHQSHPKGSHFCSFVVHIRALAWREEKQIDTGSWQLTLSNPSFFLPLLLLLLPLT